MDPRCMGRVPSQLLDQQAALVRELTGTQGS